MAGSKKIYRRRSRSKKRSHKKSRSYKRKSRRRSKSRSYRRSKSRSRKRKRSVFRHKKYKIGRPSPGESATEYYVGFTMTGQDGNVWAVRSNKNGIHRWARTTRN